MQIKKLKWRTQYHHGIGNYIGDYFGAGLLYF